MKRYQFKQVKELCTNLLVKEKVPEDEARIVANMILDATIDGVDTHGLIRLPTYLAHLKTGKMNSRPQLSFTQENSILNVDGDNGLGQLIALKTINRLLEISEEEPLCVGFVKNSNHLGALSSYCKIAAKQGKFCVAFTNSTSGIPPWGGTEPYFGTNPIAFGFPNKDGGAIIIDLSSSVTARGNIILAKKKGDSIPENWALDREGNSTTDPTEALKGSVLPVGGGKGYALAFAVEMMAGVLSGAAFGSHVGRLYDFDNLEPINTGHCFIIMNLFKVMERANYYERLEKMMKEIKENPLRPGFTEIRIPGERRARIAKERFLKGIPIEETLLYELNRLSVAYGIPGLE